MMNGYVSVVNTFDLLKRKGWIKVGTPPVDDIFFPNCTDIAIKCVGDSNKYPIWLLSLPHNLAIDLFSNKNYFDIEIDRFNNMMRLLIYQENILYMKKDLIKISDFENLINNNIYKMALIYSDNKIEKKQHFFRYNELKLLRLKGFDNLLRLINNNVIKIKINSKSIRFVISKKDLEKLYKIEYSYNDKLNSFLSFLDK